MFQLVVRYNLPQEGDQVGAHNHLHLHLFYFHIHTAAARFHTIVDRIVADRTLAGRIVVVRMVDSFVDTFEGSVVLFLRRRRLRIR